jgi:hypothetical protein
MINLEKIALIFITIGLLLGCNSKPVLHISEYAGWIENPENGFIKTKDFDEVRFISFYKPPVYRVLKEVGSNENVNLDSVQNQISQLEDWHTFTFRVKTKEHPLEQGNQNNQDYFQKLEYYINAQSDFKLIIGKSDTIPCAIYHMERNYGGAPYIDINVAFKKESQTLNNITMLYFDRVFSNGPLKFNYHLDETTSLPQYVL